jgi:hypothetical protein
MAQLSETEGRRQRYLGGAKTEQYRGAKRPPEQEKTKHAAMHGQWL